MELSLAPPYSRLFACDGWSAWTNRSRADWQQEQTGVVLEVERSKSVGLLQYVNAAISVCTSAILGVKSIVWLGVTSKEVERVARYLHPSS